jgi:hypothetical protein
MDTNDGIVVSDNVDIDGTDHILHDDNENESDASSYEYNEDDDDSDDDDDDNGEEDNDCGDLKPAAAKTNSSRKKQTVFGMQEAPEGEIDISLDIAAPTLARAIQQGEHYVSEELVGNVVSGKPLNRSNQVHREEALSQFHPLEDFSDGNADLLNLIWSFLDPESLLRVDGTCRNLRRSTETTWNACFIQHNQKCAVTLPLQNKTAKAGMVTIATSPEVQQKQQRIQMIRFAWCSKYARQMEALDRAHSCRLPGGGRVPAEDRCNKDASQCPFPATLALSALQFNSEYFDFFIRLSQVKDIHGEREILWEGFRRVHFDNFTLAKFRFVVTEYAFRGQKSVTIVAMRRNHAPARINPRLEMPRLFLATESNVKGPHDNILPLCRRNIKTLHYHPDKNDNRETPPMTYSTLGGSIRVGRGRKSIAAGYQEIQVQLAASYEEYILDFVL